MVRVSISLFTSFEEGSSRSFSVSLFVFLGWVLISDRVFAGSLSVTVPFAPLRCWKSFTRRFMME